MRSTPLSRSTCPTCGTTLEVATSVADDVTPADGTISVCLYCGTPSMFSQDLTLRPMTPEELEALSPEMTRALAQMQRFVQWRKERT